MAIRRDIGQQLIGRINAAHHGTHLDRGRLDQVLHSRRAPLVFRLGSAGREIPGVIKQTRGVGFIDEAHCCRNVEQSDGAFVLVRDRSSDLLGLRHQPRMIQRPRVAHGGFARWRAGRDHVLNGLG
jgi:hypothetical protein